MTLVDYERAWLRLKKRIGEKRSHGQKDLAVAMAEIEIECELDESSTTQTPTEPDRRQLSESGMSDDPNPLLAQEARNGRRSNSEHPVRS